MRETKKLRARTHACLGGSICPYLDWNSNFRGADVGIIQIGPTVSKLSVDTWFHIETVSLKIEWSPTLFNTHFTAHLGAILYVYLLCLSRKHHSTLFTAHLGENYFITSFICTAIAIRWMYTQKRKNSRYTCVWSLDLEIICSWRSLTKHSLYFLFTDTLLQLCSVSGKWVLQGTQFRLVCDCWKSEKCFEEILFVYKSSNLKIISYDISHPWSHLNWLDLQEPCMAIVSTWNQDSEPYLYLDKCATL